MDKINVVYILSTGRSGSTLLDLLLGSHDSLWTLGEAQLLPWELREERAPCGCGKPISHCEFWQRVLPEIPTEVEKYPIDHFRERYGSGKVLRWELATSILTAQISAKQKQAVRTYGEVNAQYFQAVKQAARERGHDVEWLVDASKDVYRLFWLQQSDRFELRVVHLTKDPRAFVYSMIRRQSSVSLHQVIRIAGRWLVENFLHRVLLQRHFSSANTIHLKYEDVAKDPAKILLDITRWIEVPSTKVESGEENMIRQYTNHAVSGNEMRWEDTEVRVDKKWINEMRKAHKVISYIISLPIAKNIGY